MSQSDSSFLSRWSRRKLQVREGGALPDEAAVPQPVPVAAVVAPAAPPHPEPAASNPPAAVEPAPTLADVAALSMQSDYTRFVARGVAPEVKNAALKKLFTDPHFNLMDGLDTYIDDYGKPDPLPVGMLRKMAQSRLLGLFDDDEVKDTPALQPATLPAACQEAAPSPSADEPGTGRAT
jgi:Protein of unknown function (DUF3306)